MARCLFAPRAVQDFADIYDYLAQFDPDAADRLVSKIESTCKLLGEQPRMARRCEYLSPGLWSFPVKDYIVYYELIRGGIEVVQIIQGSRDQKLFFRIYWKR